MSKRNKSENKSARRAERENRVEPARRAISTIDLESSAAVLTEKHVHGKSMGARARKYLKRSRADLLVMEIVPAKVLAEKLNAKLKTLTLVQLKSRRDQFAHRAAGALHHISKLSPGSKFIPALQTLHKANTEALIAANTEIARRLDLAKSHGYLNPDGN